MSKEQSLEKYTRAKQAIDEHIEANKAVFMRHQTLVMNLVDAENDLRDDVAIDGKGVENIDFKVSCEPVVQEVVDMEALQTYIKAGTIPAGIVTKNKRPPRISIRAIPQV